MTVLVVNAGSSSLKISVFGPGLEGVLSGRVTEIGSEAAHVEIGPLTGTRRVADHQAALALVFEAMEEAGIPTAGLTAVASSEALPARNDRRPVSTAALS